MSVIPQNGVSASVAYGLINEPTIAARETMDDARLADLVASIRARGLLQPIGLVTLADGRYEISYGHRRFKALGVIGVAAVDAIVYPLGTDPEAMKVDENEDREELNVGEAALYLNELLETRCAGDVDRLCEHVRRKRGWVEDRLLLLAGDLAVLEALRQRAIRFSVAKELNKVRDDGARAQFLDAARRGGSTGALVRQWREQHELYVARQDQPAGAGSDASAAHTPQSADSALRCHYCGSDDDVAEMRVVYIHHSCLRVEERARDATRRQAAP